MPSTLDLAARLSSIVAAHQEIVTCVPDTAQVMNVAARHAQQITDADGAVVEALEGEELAYRAMSGKAVAAPGLRLRVEDSLSGVALRTRQSIRCDDTDIDTRADRDTCRKVGIRSMIVVPLLHRCHSHGVLKSF